MAQSLVKILVHIVFSTKNRAEMIHLEVGNDLHAYIHGIIENNGAKLIIANGTTNHSHFLVSLARNDVSVLIGDVKRGSSLWIKKKGIREFYWQKGYGVFSIGESQVEAVSAYIRKQKVHHKTQSYEDEFRSLCRKYKVEIDERY
ncbi:MAG: IS200/IS605 family transposase [Acidobacteriota bacterium]